jgi:hypothetical protein
MLDRIERHDAGITADDRPFVVGPPTTLVTTPGGHGHVSAPSTHTETVFLLNGGECLMSMNQVRDRIAWDHFAAMSNSDNAGRVFEMSGFRSRCRGDLPGHMESRAPFIGGRAEVAVPIPPAARASVARFKAIEARLEAYEKSRRGRAGGDDLAPEAGPGRPS